MSESTLITAAREWVIDCYPYNRAHLLRALERLDQVVPSSSEAVRLATLTHDMERAFPGPDQPVNRTLTDPDCERAHAERSAWIVGEWLVKQGADTRLVEEVERLIQVHETGGWPEADLVQSADALSFLETNIDLFLGFARSGEFTRDDVRRKFELTRDRVRLPQFKELAEPLAARALERLRAQDEAAS